MRIGYARASRRGQRLGPRRDALLADGRERVFEEKVSSREAERGSPREAFDWCREGDVLVVARLDRPGRSPRELVDLVGELEGGGGAGFRGLKQSRWTPRRRPAAVAGGSSTSSGRPGGVRGGIIRERPVAGPGSARARGRRGGRPGALDENRARLAQRLKSEGDHSVEEICSMLGVGRPTLYRYLRGADGGGRRCGRARRGGDVTAESTLGRASLRANDRRPGKEAEPERDEEPEDVR